MKGILGFGSLLGLAGQAQARAMVTAPAKLAPLEKRADLISSVWTVKGIDGKQVWTTYDLSSRGLGLFTSNNYWGLAEIGSYSSAYQRGAATGCALGTVHYPSSSSDICTSSTLSGKCIVEYLYSTPSATTRWTRYACNYDDATSSRDFYLASMVSATTTSSTAFSTNPSSYVAPTREASSPTPTPSPSTPVGAIVGGVVGGLAVLGLCILGAIFLLRHSRNKTSDTPVQPSHPSQPQYMPLPQPMQQAQQYPEVMKHASVVSGLTDSTGASPYSPASPYAQGSPQFQQPGSMSAQGHYAPPSGNAGEAERTIAPGVIEMPGQGVQGGR